MEGKVNANFCDFLKSSYHRAREQQFFEKKTKKFFFRCVNEIRFSGFENSKKKKKALEEKLSSGQREVNTNCRVDEWVFSFSFLRWACSLLAVRAGEDKRLLM